jgi:hypothetical protein
MGPSHPNSCGRLVSNLEKRKATPICPYLFHLYSKNELLTAEEIDELETAKKYLELGLTPEAKSNPDIVELESEGGSPSPKERAQMAGTSSSGKMKYTYKGLDGKPVARYGEMKTTFSSEDDPFRRAFDELEEAHFRYNKLEAITKGASKLLGDCKAENISKELKKLKEKGTAALEARNASLTKEVADLKTELALKGDEIRELKVRTDGLELIREVLGTLVEVVNKAHLFDEVVKVGGQVSATKIMKVLVTFTWKMD